MRIKLKIFFGLFIAFMSSEGLTGPYQVPVLVCDVISRSPICDLPYATCTNEPLISCKFIDKWVGCRSLMTCDRLNEIIIGNSFDSLNKTGQAQFSSDPLGVVATDLLLLAPTPSSDHVPVSKSVDSAVWGQYLDSKHQHSKKLKKMLTPPLPWPGCD